MTPYEILNVSSSADHDTVKKAYRDLCFIHHPDVGGSQQKFLQIKKAYDDITKNLSNRIIDPMIEIKNEYIKEIQNCINSEFCSEDFKTSLKGNPYLTLSKKLPISLIVFKKNGGYSFGFYYANRKVFDKNIYESKEQAKNHSLIWLTLLNANSLEW